MHTLRIRHDRTHGRRLQGGEHQVLRGFSIHSGIRSSWFGASPGSVAPGRRPNSATPFSNAGEAIRYRYCVQRSSQSASFKGSSMPRRTANFIDASACGSTRASSEANSIVTDSSSPAGTAMDTSPICCASRPVILRPVSRYSSARGNPNLRGNRCEPPPPGNRFRRICSSPSSALSSAITISQESANSSPPASA
ncbi:hypothetical protein CC56_0461 [Bordetella pertussis H934]|nr:hypothetical protein CC56_0461 [Bordetella pertussis H934]